MLLNSMDAKKCKVCRRTAVQREHMAYITTTSEGDYNAQWENVGIPDDLRAPSRTRSGPADPLHGELFRLLQRPCDLLSTLEFPAQDFYPYECNPKAECCSALMVN